MNNEIIPQQLIDKMNKDRNVRVAITRESHWYFFHFYFAHYITYATADFQKDIIALTEDDSINNLFVVAFRGSGKSTIITTSYPLWAILGKQQKKFILILGQTRNQAKQHMMNLKRELESNDLLRNDLGPFQEEGVDAEWGATSLVFSNYNARITVASTEQSIRGIRHDQYRPDLIIGDDVEDVNSVKTREGREKTYNWLTGEIIPIGDKNTRLIIVGNLLHQDSLLMRIKEAVAENRMSGIFKFIPLLNEDNHIAWPGKYPTLKDIEIEKERVCNEIAWQREYLLKIIPDDAQVIYPEWIKYYDELPPKTHRAYRCTYVAVDLAISQKDSADYTAIVSAMVFGRMEKLKIYILPNPIVKKITFPEQVELLKSYNNTTLDSSKDILLVEGVGYQDALPQMLETLGIKAMTVKPTTDKRTRLALTAPMIQSGKVKFPREGAEEIIQQIIGFGVEKHDDVADAFSMLVNKIAEIHFNEPTWFVSVIDNYTSDMETFYSPDYVDVEGQA